MSVVGRAGAIGAPGAGAIQKVEKLENGAFKGVIRVEGKDYVVKITPPKGITYNEGVFREDLLAFIKEFQNQPNYATLAQQKKITADFLPTDAVAKIQNIVMTPQSGVQPPKQLHYDPVEKPHVDALKKCLQGYGRTQKLALMDTILADQHLQYCMTPTDLSRDGELNLCDLLQRPSNKPIFTALRKVYDDVVKEPPTGFFRKVFDKVYAFFRANPVRVYILHEMNKGPQTARTDEGVFTQEFRRFPDREGAPPIPNQAVPSINRTTPHATNLGVVSLADSSGAQTLVTSRSGRTDTVAKLKEMATASATKAWECAGGVKDRLVRQPGYYFQKDGCHYRMTISTFLDFSKLKIGQSERGYLKDMIAALDAWGPSQKVTIDRHEVIIDRPIVTQEVLSQLAQFGTWGGRETSDACNFFGDHALCMTAIREHATAAQKDRLKSVSKQFAEAIAKMTGKGHATYLDKEDGLIDFQTIPLTAMLAGVLSPDLFRQIDRDAVRDLDGAIASVLHEQMYSSYSEWQKTPDNNEKAREYQAWVALYGLLLHRTPPDPSVGPGVFIRSEFTSEILPHERVSEVDHCIYRNIVCKHFGFAMHAECKSGKDRTSTGVAISVAEARFLQATGRYYLPPRPTECSPLYDDQLRFKVYVDDAYRQFGLPLSVESQGKFGLKIETHAIAPLLLNQEDCAVWNARNPEDIRIPRVRGITYHDIARRGNYLYRGTVVSCDYLGRVKGRGHAILKQARADAKTYAREREKARGSVNKFLRGVFRPPEVFPNELFDSNLALSVHSSSINFTAKTITVIQEHIQELRKPIFTPDQQQKASREVQSFYEQRMLETLLRYAAANNPDLAVHVPEGDRDISALYRLDDRVGRAIEKARARRHKLLLQPSHPPRVPKQEAIAQAVLESLTEADENLYLQLSNYEIPVDEGAEERIAILLRKLCASGPSGQARAVACYRVLQNYNTLNERYKQIFSTIQPQFRELEKQLDTPEAVYSDTLHMLGRLDFLLPRLDPNSPSYTHDLAEINCIRNRYSVLPDVPALKSLFMNKGVTNLWGRFAEYVTFLDVFQPLLRTLDANASYQDHIKYAHESDTNLRKLIAEKEQLQKELTKAQAQHDEKKIKDITGRMKSNQSEILANPRLLKQFYKDYKRQGLYINGEFFHEPVPDTPDTPDTPVVNERLRKLFKNERIVQQVKQLCVQNAVSGFTDEAFTHPDKFIGTQMLVGSQMAPGATDGRIDSFDAAKKKGLQYCLEYDGEKNTLTIWHTFFALGHDPHEQDHVVGEVTYQVKATFNLDRATAEDGLFAPGCFTGAEQNITTSMPQRTDYAYAHEPLLFP